MMDKLLEFQNKLIEGLATKSEKNSFLAGYSCGAEGANTENCHFSFFSSPANTAAWEAGKAQAEADKKVIG